MRDLEDARESWQRILTYPALSDVRLAVRSDENKSSPLIGSRSLCWKAFLLFEDSAHSEWLRRISDSRSAYVSVRTHLLKALEHPEELASGYDPLSEGIESPWAALRQDEALRAEILQDVDRCMPENMYFRQPETQKMLLDILFVFCKLNPDVSYRQGMHELLAPILWVVERDALSPQPSGELSSDDEMLCEICDLEFIEHDTFTLFGIVMQGAKSFYEQAAHSAPSQLAVGSPKPAATLENPILTRIHRIFDEYLPHVDPKLAQHLREIDMIPQVFLMKWIRLIFGREFGFDDVLAMWDVIFAEDPTLEIVDFVCLVMIIRLHWDLIESDYNTALTLLLRYPAPSDSMAPQKLVLDALYLRDHLHQSGASHVIERNTGRRLATGNANSEKALPPTPQTMLGSGLQAVGFPTNSSRQPPNFDRVFQDAAKGLFKRGEEWGINKAVRDAIVEVRKGVREIQNSPTPQISRTHIRAPSWQSGTGDRAGAKLAALEQRTVSLAKMLKNATDDLWKYHEDAVGGKGSEKDNLEALSVAIARVQFTQVYLEDSTVPLPTEDEDATEVETDSAPKTEANDKAVNDEKLEGPRPPTSESTITPAPIKSRPKKASIPNASDPPPKALHHTPRPSLTQSSFSWILGQESSPGSFVQAKAFPPSEERRQNRGFLFGDEEPSSSIGSSPKDSSKGKGGNKLRKKKPDTMSSKAAEVLFEQESEVWDLGKLEEEKSRKQQEEKQRADAAVGEGAS
ncbi:rab-GTPase-TBC domain-containing protein [Delphinella strobiligena]|nr:rab-GTPase-TBC domain-containing protein [Delphinella strobiligena]